jgi:hypothetical protein
MQAKGNCGGPVVRQGRAKEKGLETRVEAGDGKGEDNLSLSSSAFRVRGIRISWALECYRYFER